MSWARLSEASQYRGAESGRVLVIENSVSGCPLISAFEPTPVAHPRILGAPLDITDDAATVVPNLQTPPVARIIYISDLLSTGRLQIRLTAGKRERCRSVSSKPGEILSTALPNSELTKFK